jgi:hypothetical protein
VLVLSAFLTAPFVSPKERHQDASDIPSKRFKHTTRLAYQVRPLVSKSVF